MIAVLRHHPDVVDLLLRKSALVHLASPRTSKTALMYAAEQRDWECVSLLAAVAHLDAAEQGASHAREVVR